ncbi:hypothetical protein JCM24511_00785 [Saitozyma sp. JCM 24511]|nr:hypothetical protein JCM24511_00785 [Saitozyma sp. JCM 24511]
MITPRLPSFRARSAVFFYIGLIIVGSVCLYIVDPDRITENGLSPRRASLYGPISEREQLPWSAIARQDEGCGMCAMDKELCAELGEASLARAVSYAGSNDRLRRVLARLRAGEPLTYGAIGGSISLGHGVGPDYDPNEPRVLHRLVFEHLNRLFPQKAGTAYGESGRDRGMNSYVNGALGATGSDYFSLCFKEHIPEDVDLVVIELAVNDEPQVYVQESYERLVRSLLDLPRKPAVLNLQVFQLMFSQILGGGDQHMGVAQYYDLPVISLRNAVLPAALGNASFVRELFHHFTEEPQDDLSDVDTRHIDVLGHRLSAQLVNAYIDSQLCEMDRLEARAGIQDIDELYPSPILPRLRVWSQYDPHSHLPSLAPNCFSMNSRNNKLVSLRSDGWREWNWGAKHYLIADQPGSTITFGFSTQIGAVRMNFLRSETFGLGSVVCWVDNDRDRGTVLDGYWNEPYNIGKVATIRDGLASGDHELHCELLDNTADPNGGREFRIISVMSF